MAEKSTFGIDGSFLKSIDFELAGKRIISDLRSDFILAPHISCIYYDSFDLLKEDLYRQLESGKFAPQLPVSIDIPKKQRIRHVGVKRLAPNFTRPGSILFPRERLLYQILADQAQPIVESKLNRDVCFSHQPAAYKDNELMFRSSRECWSAMQHKLRTLIGKGYPLVLRADIASCFQSINQHTLVNTLEYAGYPKPLLKPLESALVQTSISRSSRGILQGIFPSDLFGNFYLYPLDRYFTDNGIPVVRYVDDIYAFFSSADELDKHVLGLYAELRKLDLYLNEAKTIVTTPIGLLTSDPDLDQMFQEAVIEVETALGEDSEEIYTDYGFQTIWEDDEEDDDALDEEEIELAATTKLFQESVHYPDNSEEIERFCLPILAQCRSDYAVDYVLSRIESAPSMAQIYFSYLSAFLDEEKVQQRICQVIKDRKLIFDWQYIWAIACLIKFDKLEDSVLGDLLALSNSTIHESVKALALIAVVKHGDVGRQRQ